MDVFQFEFLKIDKIKDIIPLMQDFTAHIHSDQILEERFRGMFTFAYDCVGIYKDSRLIGICGLWYQVRHYSGKSCELDHFYIVPEFRGSGVGKKFLDWLTHELSEYDAIELNAYIPNEDSHRFYEREGFKKLGFHFVRDI